MNTHSLGQIKDSNLTLLKRGLIDFCEIVNGEVAYKKRQP